MDKPEDPKQSPGPGPGPLRPLPSSRMDIDDESVRRTSHASNVMAVVMLIAIVVLGTLFYVSVQRNKVAEKAKKEAADKAAAQQAAADSIAKHQQDSLFAARSDSLAKLEAKKPKKPAAAAGAAGTAAGGAAAPATPPPPPTKYGIDVGTFLNEERANSEQSKLQSSTGLSGKVTPVTEDGVTSYRVILGEFSSKAEADKKANDLIVGQAVREAKVIKLKAGS